MQFSRPFAAPTATPGQAHILLIPLAAITANKLQRDRTRRLDPALEDLKASILATGLFNPIRVEPLGQGGFDLIQGWRRLSAYRALHAETEDPRFAAIPATLVEDHIPIAGLYRRMVDENMVRKDISWAEMARLAMGYATDPATACGDLDAAVNTLYASASAQKRSYIRRFAGLMIRLEKVLEHPEAIPRALGLDLAAALEADPSRLTPLCNALRRDPHRDASAELEILRRFATDCLADSAAISPRGNQARKRGRPVKRSGCVMHFEIMGEPVRCTLAAGRIELRLDRALGGLPRHRLEAAIAAFCAVLG